MRKDDEVVELTIDSLDDIAKTVDSMAGAAMAPFLGFPAVFSPQDAFR